MIPKIFCACGTELLTMCAQSDGRCHTCAADARDQRKAADLSDLEDQVVTWQTGLGGVQTHELVDELLKRGWDEDRRTRNYKKRLVLIAPPEAEHLQAPRQTA